MELFQPSALTAGSHLTHSLLAARYRPVLWQPVAGTHERIVALLAIEPLPEAVGSLSPATHVALPRGRLTQLLGKQRAAAAEGLLAKTAEFMTHRQLAGEPLSELRAPFTGFELAPMRNARGASLAQLLDAAVRAQSAFATAEAMLEDAEPLDQARHTMRTAEFLNNLYQRLRKGMDANEAKARFNRPLALPESGLEAVIDYSHQRLLAQVASLPLTEKQAQLASREARAKVFDIELATHHMPGVLWAPALVVNTQPLVHSMLTDAERRHAESALHTFKLLAGQVNAVVIEAPNADSALEQLVTLG